MTCRDDPPPGVNVTVSNYNPPYSDGDYLSYKCVNPSDTLCGGCFRLKCMANGSWYPDHPKCSKFLPFLSFLLPNSLTDGLVEVSLMKFSNVATTKCPHILNFIKTFSHKIKIKIQIVYADRVYWCSSATFQYI